MSVVFIKQAGDHIVTGGKTPSGDYESHCTCGHALWGHESYNAMTKWVRTHAAKHLVKAVA